MKFRQLFWSASDWRPLKSLCYTATSRWWWTKFQRRIWCEGTGSEAEMDQLKKLHPSAAMCFRCQWQRCYRKSASQGASTLGTRIADLTALAQGSKADLLCKICESIQRVITENQAGRWWAIYITWMFMWYITTISDCDSNGKNEKTQTH